MTSPNQRAGGMARNRFTTRSAERRSAAGARGSTRPADSVSATAIPSSPVASAPIASAICTAVTRITADPRVAVG